MFQIDDLKLIQSNIPAFPASHIPQVFSSAHDVAVKLFPRQSNWSTELQHGKLGVVGWRLVGNLFSSVCMLHQLVTVMEFLQPNGLSNVLKHITSNAFGV